MRLILLCLYVCVFLQIKETSAQYWVPVGDGFNFEVRELYVDNNSNTMYAGGGFWMSGSTPVQYIAEWTGSDWAALPSFQNSSSVLTMINFDNELYVGGFSITNEASLKRWDGTDWETVGNGTNGIVHDIEVFEGELYVAGSYSMAGNIVTNGVSKWDGSNWHSLDFPNYELGQNFVTVNAIAFYNGELYIGGGFRDETGDRVNIAKYDGQNWQTVGEGLVGQFAAVFDLTVYDNELYVSGRFNRAEGNPENGIVRWDGNNWIDLGGGVYNDGDEFGGVYDLEIIDGKLIVGGSFNRAGNIRANSIASWDGETWCTFTNEYINGVNTIAEYNGELYIGGGFETIGSDTLNFVAEWTGGNHADTCATISGIEDADTETTKLTIYPNPTNSTITLTWQAQNHSNNYQLQLYDGKGKLIITETLRAAQGSKVLDMSAFSKGIYFGRLLVGEEDRPFGSAQGKSFKVVRE